MISGGSLAYNVSVHRPTGHSVSLAIRAKSPTVQLGRSRWVRLDSQRYATAAGADQNPPAPTGRSGQHTGKTEVN